MLIVLHFITIISLLSRVYGESDKLRSSPVFIIDYDHVNTESPALASNPFVSINESYFQRIVQKTKEKAEAFIVFVEEHLCTEDMSVKDHLGTPYYHLQSTLNDNKAIYFPAVINPFKIISHTLPPQQYNIFHLRSPNTKLELFEGHKYIYIYFEDGKNETRTSALRRHDLIMREVYFVLRQLVTGPVVAIYTGKRNPVSKHALRYSYTTSDKKPKSVLNFYSDNARYRFGG